MSVTLISVTDDGRSLTEGPLSPNRDSKFLEMEDAVRHLRFSLHKCYLSSGLSREARKKRIKQIDAHLPGSATGNRVWASWSPCGRSASHVSILALP